MDELTWNCVKGIQAQLDMAYGQLKNRIETEALSVDAYGLLTDQLKAIGAARLHISAYKSARAKLEHKERSAK